MLEINTGELRGRKKVLIDGHEYIVRRLGAGEQLRMSQLNTEFQQLQKKAEDMNPTETKRVNEIADKMFGALAATFDDGGDGTKSLDLVARLDQDAITELMAKIFDETPATNTTD